MIPIVDDHTHLFYEPIINDLHNYLQRNKEAGVIALINNTSNIETVKKAINFSHEIVFHAFGIHPLHVNEFSLEDLEFIEKHIDKAIAIGEVGLDYTINNKEKQKQLFEFFIHLSEKTGKPLIIHSRKAELDVVNLLESSNAKVVLHYFAGRKWLVKRAINNGWMLSIPTNIVKLQQLQQNVDLCPLNQLLTETDAPWLSPYKDVYPNESRYIIESLKKISEIKHLPIEEVALNIVKNFEKTFKVSLNIKQ